MDSGNSGSMQSSSGGDEEYDSRAAANSFFMTRSISTTPPLFDPFSTPWPRPASMRSDPIPSTSHAIFQAPPARNTAARNPRKRPRASRRAPTTVLNTDTANFRAMVQEFTGIPAPPFNNSSSSFQRSRLDLFTTRSAAFDAAPPYLRRPFPQNPQSPPPFSIALASTPFNYQLPITFQNPNTFTSLLQSNPKFLFSNSDVITSKPYDHDSFGIPTSDDDFNLSHRQIHASTSSLTALPNLVSTDQMKIPNCNKNAENSTGYHHQMTATTVKMDCPAPPPEFGGGRGEGMVESWICSSE